MKSDRRAKYSEKVIRETYLEMLAEMPAEKITVTELCERADLNRGTFYLHYRDCRDLLETLGAELAESQKDRIEHMFSSEQSLQKGMVEITNELFSDGINNRILFSNEQDKCFDLIFQYAKEKTLRSWSNRSQLTGEQAELVFSFISGGSFNVAKAINAGLLEGNDENFSTLFDLLTRGLYSVVEKLP